MSGRSLYAPCIHEICNSFQPYHHRVLYSKGFCLGFFLSTVLGCFLSFVFNIYPTLPAPISVMTLLFQSFLPPLIYMVLTRSPIHVRPSNLSTGNSLNPGLVAVLNGEHPTKYCPETKMILPPKSKYCKITKAAYYDFDHHCLFLMKTIARGNHHIFIVFVGSLGKV